MLWLVIISKVKTLVGRLFDYISIKMHYLIVFLMVHYNCKSRITFMENFKFGAKVKLALTQALDEF